MTYKVYLAGPITGLDFEGATDWRQYAIDCLKPAVGLSPMRGKDYLKGIPSISGTGEEYVHLGPLSLPRGVLTRDRFDTTRCDVLLVNLAGAKKVSIGTCMEIAWADLCRIPIICAMEKGNPHEHMMVTEALGYRVETLDQALDLTRHVLGI